MLWMNRNSKKLLITGISIVGFIFALPLFWPVDAVWYYSNLNWLIPLTIVIFIAPTVSLILGYWDVHFSFQDRHDNLTAIISNYGTNPYNFNRVQFSSNKKYGILGKREFYPKSGLSDENVVFHGADTLSQTLHQHIGCTLKKGLPITLVVRGRQVPENLRHFQKNSKIYLSLYYEGTKQRVYSQRIPPKIVMEITQNSK